MKCIKCSQDKKVKDGTVRGKQRYRCKNCNYRFTVEQRSTAKPLESKRLALRLYLEGMGFRAIGRALGISFVTIYKWVKKSGKSVKISSTQEPVDTVELDEIHTYVGQKKTTVGHGLRLTEKARNS